MLLLEYRCLPACALLLWVTACAGSSDATSKTDEPTVSPPSEALRRFPVTIGRGHVDFPTEPHVYALPGNAQIARIYVARLETERLEQMVAFELRQAMPEATPVEQAAQAFLSDYMSEHPDADRAPPALTVTEAAQRADTAAFGTSMAYRLVEPSKVHEVRIVVAQDAVYRLNVVTTSEPGPLDDRTSRFFDSLRIEDTQPPVVAPDAQ